MPHDSTPIEGFKNDRPIDSKVQVNMSAHSPELRSDHLARVCWLVINEHKNLYGGPPSSLYFNKALSLLHKRLKEGGFDLKLPHCWYRYGDEVVRFWMPDEVLMDKDNQTLVEWAGREPKRPTDALAIEAYHCLEDILKDFQAQKHIEDMVDIVYEYAPFEFQRTYRKVRHAHYDANASILDPQNIAKLIIQYIKDAHAHFPHEQFPLASFYAECAFESSIETLGSDPTKLKLVKDVLENFWEYWCYHLRLHPRGHENVPRSTLELWEQELGPQEKEYAVVFLSHFSEMLKIVPDLRKNELFSSWLARLDVSDDDADQGIDDWSEVFDGIDDFVQGQKSGFGAA